MTTTDYLTDLAKDLIQMDKETAIVLDKWPAAKRFVGIILDESLKPKTSGWKARVQILHDGMEVYRHVSHSSEARNLILTVVGKITSEQMLGRLNSL